MSIFSVRESWHYAALVAATCAASFPFAEGGFRVIGDRTTDELAGLYVPFGSGGYKLRPSVDTEADWPAGKFRVHTDGLGLRCDGQREMAAKPGDRVDFLFLGDSQGYGNGVDFEDSLCGAVAGFALRDGLHVANASVGGHATLNQLELVKWLQMEHRVTASTYVLMATPLMVQYPQSYTRAKVGEDGRLYDSADGFGPRARLWLKSHFVIYDRLRDAARNLGIGNHPKDNHQMALNLYGGGSPETTARTNFTMLLNQVKLFAQEQRAELIVIYVPLTVEADFEGMREAGNARGMSLDPNLPRRICANAAARLGLALYDLGPVLKELHAQGDPLRLKGDFHYDRKLSRACPMGIYDMLRQGGRVASRTMVSE